MAFPTRTFLILATLLITVLAHPGHDVGEEASERLDFFKREPRTIRRSCASNLRRRGYTDAAVQRRNELFHSLRAKRNLPPANPILHRRDFADYNFTHESTSPVSMQMEETQLFTDNSSCTLQTEVTQGPYYVTGELIRQDVGEDQEGIPLYLDIQYIDTSTCQPVPAGIFVDLWHCNSTGVYSGVVANGNGVGDEDATNINNTFLRGIQQTDVNGIVQFQTVFPGHYSGRATHIHILSHSANTTTVNINGTLLSSTSNTTHASHVGQLFFDQSLIELVETTAPYNTNNQSTTLNSDDQILNSEADTTDPFVEYALLGESVEEGILAWISVGIDLSADSEIGNAATIYETGGVANEDGGMIGGGPGGSGGPLGNGTGGPPSGTGMPPAASGTAVGSSSAFRA